ncbi:hypothetical protein P8452_35668 [Trifolium repens]|nr:hypothetical protein P8452_35668 [Trifolium repens]
MNKFSSVIPQDIGIYLSSTTFLSLSRNNLHGSIPNSLCQASNLHLLDLSFNNFSGSIPSCLKTMTKNLKVLNLRRNSLQGPIPDNFSASCALQTLNLHGNLLHGPVPKSLSHCSKLEVLDIGTNQIVGQFPCFLQNIPTLKVLVLRNNKFHGTLRCSKAKYPWKMIQIVDNAFNNFSGKLPEKYFRTLEKMKDDNVKPDIIQFDIYGAYYQDSVTVMSKGNYGLYGPPLTETQNGMRPDEPHPQPACGRLACSIDWSFLSVELGFVFGLGIIIGPILFWKLWRVRYWKLVDKILCWMFSRMYLEYATDSGQTYTVLRW